MSTLPNKAKKFPEWYQEVIRQAELVDNAPVRGCMVIRPYGNELWEAMKSILDKKIKDTGHKNAVFPLLIPESFFKKEAEHVEGFAPELAVVTHAGGKELAEPLVVRPTSETMVHHMFAQWIKSYRDLPLKINQWANVVRWEMRPRAFLRTSEFFWQEGHTAHSTKEEALEEVLLILDHYKDLAENYLAIPVITGVKSEGEKFPGAEQTYTFEAFMPDAKALQMGTSHLLSQNFAHAFEMKYQNKEGKIEHPWLTSWGTTTRLVGALIMMHGDDKGLIIPPKIAPLQVVFVPIYRNQDEKQMVLADIKKLQVALEQQNVRVFVDEDDHKKPGNKFFHWELKGIPVRIEIGPRDIVKEQVVLVTRLGEKETVSYANLAQKVVSQLDAIQKELYVRAEKRLAELKITVKTEDELKKYANSNVMQTGFCGQRACEDQLKRYKLSVRCIIPEVTVEECFHCKNASQSDCIIARSY